MRVLDLFSGIGGFSLGLERAGMETVAFCEIDPYCRKVLAKHWPNVPIYKDVRILTDERLRQDGIVADVITGGFPCQDISTAGNQQGITEETRSGLWSEIYRLIGEIRPRYAIVENVSNLLVGPPEMRGGWFGRILGDLASIGYDAEWENIPAATVGAPHRRERVWIVAYPQQNSNSLHSRPLAEAQEKLSQRIKQLYARSETGNICSHWGTQSEWRAKSPPMLVDDGFPNLVAEYAATGNAVVPQIPELIGSAIMETK